MKPIVLPFVTAHGLEWAVWFRHRIDWFDESWDAYSWAAAWESCANICADLP